MTENQGQAAPGWYPDPSGAPRQRYFDGEIWTDHYHGEAQTTGAPQPAQSPVEYWKSVMTENYANFEGRARRAEFWWAYLINVAIMIVLAVIGTLILGDAGIFLVLIFGLAALLPMLASVVRRLHDTNKSGWWLLLSLVPFGGLVLLVFYFIDGDRGPNQYGPSPKF